MEPVKFKETNGFFCGYAAWEMEKDNEILFAGFAHHYTQYFAGINNTLYFLDGLYNGFSLC